MFNGTHIINFRFQFSFGVLHGIMYRVMSFSGKYGKLCLGLKNHE